MMSEADSISRPARRARSSVTRTPTVGALRSDLQRAMSNLRAPGFSREELDTHFDNMPQRYWARVDEPTLRWHLEALHEFFETVVTSDGYTTSPVVRWRHFPERGCSEVLVCTWDRVGLLAKIAGAFAEVDLSIIRSDVYTRSDDVVLDLFQVCTEQSRHVANEDRLRLMSQILDASLTAHREIVLNQAWLGPLEALVMGSNQATAPRVRFDNERSDDYTILEIEARDRLGLLYRIFRVLSESQVNVEQAIVTTENGAVGDVFYLSDGAGNKLRDPAQLGELRGRLIEVLS
jgi:[protein-PII] uridylyltransferase